MTKDNEQANNERRRADIRFVLKLLLVAVMAVIAAALFALLVYSIVAVANAPFCPSAGGNKKTVAVIDDSMSPAIEHGAAITVELPSSPDAVQINAVIAFRVGDAVVCRRVQSIVRGEGEMKYDVKADAGGAVERVAYSEIIGVYTGDKVKGLGGVLTSVGSPMGVVILMLAVIGFSCVVAYLIISSLRARRKKLERDALARSIKELSNINLRYDNICEITAVLDVLEMLASSPDTRAERKANEARLRNFIDAHTIELPQTPETAAVLDSLPAPDNPDTLAAALRSGATLRQAEDGQTLVLTGLSGGKSILLTPIQTPDGVMLCRQGVRIRADIAPNLEQIGVSSMPSFPEFFEGMPIEKHVEYPELPQPHEPFGPNTLNRFGGAPENADVSQAALGMPKNAQSYSKTREITSHSAYNEYLEIEAPKAKRQAKQLEKLIGAAQPLTPSELEIVKQYKQKTAKAASDKKPKQKKELTPEQAEAKKATAAEKRKQQKREKQEFINSLSAEDREKYEAEQNLKKVRAAAIRKLKKAEADRRILEQIKN